MKKVTEFVKPECDVIIEKAIELAFGEESNVGTSYNIREMPDDVREIIALSLTGEKSKDEARELIFKNLSELLSATAIDVTLTQCVFIAVKEDRDRVDDDSIDKQSSRLDESFYSLNSFLDGLSMVEKIWASGVSVN